MDRDPFDLETQELTKADVLCWLQDNRHLRLVSEDDYHAFLVNHWRPLVKLTFSGSQIPDDVFYIMERTSDVGVEMSRFQVVTEVLLEDFLGRGYFETGRVLRNGVTYVYLAR